MVGFWRQCCPATPQTALLVFYACTHICIYFMTVDLCAQVAHYDWPSKIQFCLLKVECFCFVFPIWHDKHKQVNTIRVVGKIVCFLMKKNLNASTWSLCVKQRSIYYDMETVSRLQASKDFRKNPSRQAEPFQPLPLVHTPYAHFECLA